MRLILLLFCFMPVCILTYNVNRNMLDFLYMPSICGKKDIDTTDLIFGGNTTEAHEWPWLAALYTVGTVGLKFRCGASLISSNLAVTAAHCCKHTQRGDLVVYVRKYSQYEWGDNDESISKNVVTCVIHPKYKERLTSDSDIGILVLESPVTFSTGVQPVCLPHNTEKQTEANIIGNVVGWGMTNESKVSEFPMKAEMPTVSLETCRNSHLSFKDKLTENIFCAGKRDGTGPCVGDSGGGFYVNYKGEDGREKWKLQGVVSRALRDKKKVCLNDQFFMFTDVTKFVPWINEVAKNYMPKSHELTTTADEEEAKLLLQNKQCTAQLPKLLKNYKTQVFELQERNEALTEERRRLRKDFERAYKFEVNLKATNNAGITALQNGDYLKALNALSAVLEIRRRLLGETNFLTLNTKATVATLLSQLGRHEEAETLMLELVQVESSVLKSAHVTKALIIQQLAREQTILNKLNQALATYDLAVNEMLKTDSINYTQILDAKREKANILFGLSRYEESLKIHSDILNATLEADGDIMDIIVTSRDIARAYNMLNKHVEALEILKKAMEHKGNINLPNTDLDLLLFELASTYENLGQLEEALAVYN